MGSSVMFTNHFEFSLNIDLGACGVQFTEAPEKKIGEGIKKMNTPEVKHMMWNTWKPAADFHC